jgi:DNA-binding protein HU-beta
MTKADVIDKIMQKTGLEKSIVTAVVEAMMKVMRESMLCGKNIFLRGFGTFLLKKRAEKKGRNISKNTTIIIPSHYVPSFKPAKSFLKGVRTNVSEASLI